MLTENRKFHFVGMITIKRSVVLGVENQPKDDKVNWLFLKVGEKQFSFVYKIENPLEAEYEKPFKVELAFTMIEIVESIILLNYNYEVIRGQETIGFVKLTDFLK